MPPSGLRRCLEGRSGHNSFTRSLESRGPVVCAISGRIQGAIGPTRHSKRLERRGRPENAPPLRVQLERSPLRRQRAGRNLFSEERLDNEAVVGLCNRKLVIKLLKGRHMVSGPQSTRACVCEDYPPDSLGLLVASGPRSRHAQRQATGSCRRGKEVLPELR